MSVAIWMAQSTKSERATSELSWVRMRPGGTSRSRTRQTFDAPSEDSGVSARRRLGSSGPSQPRRHFVRLAGGANRELRMQIRGLRWFSSQGSLSQTVNSLVQSMCRSIRNTTLLLVIVGRAKSTILDYLR